MNLKFLKIIGLLLAVLPGGQAARAQETASEYQVKAAFVYNFAKFIEWPPGAFPASDTPITIGVVCESADSFKGNLEKLVNGRTVGGRSLRVRVIASLQDLKGCHILFFCRSARKRLAETLSAAKTSSILTIGETDQFIPSGGIINFVMEGKQVRFEINDNNANKVNLKISSKLLSLAQNRQGGA
jgi:hypothetical protein